MTCWPHSELQAALNRRTCNSYTAVQEETEGGRDWDEKWQDTLLYKYCVALNNTILLELPSTSHTHFDTYFRSPSVNTLDAHFRSSSVTTHFDAYFRWPPVTKHFHTLQVIVSDYLCSTVDTWLAVLYSDWAKRSGNTAVKYTARF
jgi:hypothetical protein